MNLSLWKSRHAQSKTQEVIDRLNKDLGIQLEASTRNLAVLARSAGWKEVEKFFEEKERVLRDSLEIVPKEELHILQAELKAHRNLRNLLKNALMADSRK